MKLEATKLSKRLTKTIFAEVLKGKPLDRTLMNYALSEFELSGNILDLGSGSDSASYNRFLKYKKPFRITYSDYYNEGKNLIKINLEEPFEIEQNSFDCVMCFNTLEHIYNFKNVIKESYRILKKGGMFIGSSPFVYHFHPDPKDYFRYSHQALLRMFEEEGFICQKMVYLGFGPFSLAVSQWMDIAPLPKVLKFIFYLLNIFLDVKANKSSRYSKYYGMKYPFGYVYGFKKS